MLASSDSNTAPPSSNSPRPLWPLILILIGQAISFAPWITSDYQFNQFNRDDTAFYVLLAHSMANGRGYTRSLDPENYLPHAHYAPGFSLPIAGCFLVSDTLLLPHLMMAGVTLVNTVLLWFILGRYLSTPLAFLAVVLTVTSPVYDQLATVLMTEQLSIFLLLLSYWLFLRWSEAGYQFDRWFSALAISLGYGLLVRGLLVPLLPTFALYAWWDTQSPTPIRSRFAKATLLLFLAMIPFVAWGVRNASVHVEGFEGYSHTDEILRGGNMQGPYFGPKDYVQLAVTNLRSHFTTRMLDCASGAGWVSATYFDRQLTRLGSLVVLGVFFACCLTMMFAGYRYYLPLFWLAFSLALLLIWPWGGAPRYWLQIQPFLLLIVIAAVERWCAWWAPSWLRSSGIQSTVVAALCVAGVAVLVYDHTKREPQYGHVWQALVDIAHVAHEKAPPNAVLFSQSRLPVGYIARLSGEPTDRTFAFLRGEPTNEDQPVFAIVSTPKALKESARKGTKLAALDGPGATHVPGVPSEVARNDYYILYRLRPEKTSPPGDSHHGD